MFNNEYSAEQGRIDALNDINKGKLLIRTAGRPMSWVSVWIKILGENNIQFTNSGCLVSDELLEYIEAYNRVSEAEIAKRFGLDYLEKTRVEARKRYDNRDFAAQVNDFEYKANNNPQMEAKVNSYGWVKCPNCRISFKNSSELSWDGEKHLSCGQKITLIS